MQLLPRVAEALRAFTSPPARRGLAARTVLWAVAGILALAAGIFALIGTHAVLADHFSQVIASFVMALSLLFLAGLLGLGAWLAGRSKRPVAHPEHDLAVFLAGFLDGLASPAEASQRRTKHADGPQD